MTKLKSLLVVSASAVTLMMAQGAMAGTSIVQEIPFAFDEQFLNLQDATAVAGNAQINNADQVSANVANLFEGSLSSGLNDITQTVGTGGAFPVQDLLNEMSASTGGTGNASVTGTQAATNVANYANVTDVVDGDVTSDTLEIVQQGVFFVLDQSAVNEVSSEATGTGNAVANAAQSAVNVQNVANVALEEGNGLLLLDIDQDFRASAAQDALNSIEAAGRNATASLLEDGQSAVNIANIGSANGDIDNLDVLQTVQTSGVIGGTPTQTAENSISAIGDLNATVSGSESDGQFAFNAMNAFSSDNLGGLGSSQTITQEASTFSQVASNTAIAGAGGLGNAQVSNMSQAITNTINTITTTVGE